MKNMPKRFPRWWLFLGLFLLLILGAGQMLNNYAQPSNKPLLDSWPQATVSPHGSVTRVAQDLSASVIGIINYSEKGDFFNQKTEEKTGSGVIIDRSGLVVTNNHVVAGAERLVAVLSGGVRKDLVLLGRDARTDLALVKIKGTSNFKPARLGNSDQLVVGESVLAIGNPLGLEFSGSVTSGVISGLNRVITTPEGFTLRLIQTDAAINPGNSGGPLVNLSGEIIGINTVKIALPGFEGMGFSIPSNVVRQVVEDLNKHGKVVRPLLGVQIVSELTSDEARYYRLPITHGVAVVPIKGGPAQKAGISDYDILKSIDGKDIKTAADLQEAVFKHRVGDVVKLEVLRLAEVEGQKSQRLKIEVRLGQEKE